MLKPTVWTYRVELHRLRHMVLAAIAVACLTTGAVLLGSADSGKGDALTEAATSPTTSGAGILRLEFTGKVGCSVGGIIVPISTTDLCQKFELDPEASGSFQLVANDPRDVTSVWYALSWIPNLPANGEVLEFTFPMPIDVEGQDVEYESNAEVFTNHPCEDPDPRSLPPRLLCEPAADPGNPIYIYGWSPMWIRMNSLEGGQPLHLGGDDPWGTDYGARFEVRSANGNVEDLLADPPQDETGKLALNVPFHACVVLAFEGALLPDALECSDPPKLQ